MRRKLAALFSTAALICTLTLTAGIALAANPSADIDQCANDPATSLPIDGCNSNANQWVNGNLGASKSVYREGDSIPYRIRFANLSTTGTRTVTIEWDTTKASKHAIDYIDDFNESVGNANPCLGVSGCLTTAGNFMDFPIPADPQVTGAGVTPNAGSIRIYGGTITSITKPNNVGSTQCTIPTNSNASYCYSSGTGFTGDKSAAIRISFQPSRSNPVIAWGGHIATRIDWGVANSAVAISGSPYHSRLIDLDGSGGNQDRSLSAAAVVFPGSITITKDVDGGTDVQDFAFTASPLPLANFSLDDDGNNADTLSNTKVFPLTADADFGKQYTIIEGALSGWSLTGLVCSVTSPNGGSQDVTLGTRTAKITPGEGEFWSCTFTNFKLNPSLTVDKEFTSNDDEDESGTITVDDTIHYTITATNGGNVTLHNVKVDDDLTGDTITCPSVAVLGTCVLNVEYVVTQADVDAGNIHNVGTADSDETGPVTDPEDVPIEQDPELTIVKTDDGEGFSEVGDVIDYEITATNTGNVTLTNVEVTDDQVSDLVCLPSNPVASLAPGGQITCTASHTITQDDIDAGEFFNEACVDDEGTVAEDCDDVTTTGEQDPELTIVKTTTFVGKYDANDTLPYNIKVTNTGNVTLLNVKVTDLLVGDLACDPGITVASLAPGAEINCTASYDVLASDLGEGKSVTNEACADDGNGDGDLLGAEHVCDDVTVESLAQPTIATDDILIPQDSITIDDLTAGAGGSLYIELRIDGSDCGDGDPAWFYTWTGAAFTGNGTYNTADITGPDSNDVFVDDDATVVWCSSYSGDPDNAERPLSHRGEISVIDFVDALPILTGAIGFAIPTLLWGVWTLRRRHEDEKAS